MKQRFYIFHCDKCKEWVKDTFCLSKNKQEATQQMRNNIMEHDLHTHADKDNNFSGGD